MASEISLQLFDLDPRIRYVAINQGGRIEAMDQNPLRPTYNSHDTDRMEELLVNPVLLDLTRRRGDLDLDGIRYLLVRYGLQYQLVFPYRDGHLSVAVELDADVQEIARKVAAHLALPL